MKIDKVWTTRSGEKIPVVNMQTSHIENSLAMLKRNGFISPSTVDNYMCGPMPHGEMAQDAFWSEFDSILNRPVSEAIDWFEEELFRRGKLV